MSGKKSGNTPAPGRRCYDLAVEIGELACAVEGVRVSADHRDANALMTALYHVSQVKHLANDLGAAAPIARQLANRARLLGAAINARGLSMRELSKKDAGFIFEDASDMWAYVRQLQDAASRSCGTNPPGMVWPLRAFRPIPKGLGR